MKAFQLAPNDKRALSMSSPEIFDIRHCVFASLCEKLTLFAFLLLLPIFLSGQTISITSFGVALSQDSNTLAIMTSMTVPPGWAFLESGTNANTSYSAGTGSSNSGDTYSFGSTASSERAFGGLRSLSLVPTIGVAYTNNTGGTIQSLNISYTGEQWRLGFLGRLDRLDFQFSLDATSLSTGTWTDVNQLDFIAPVTTGTVGALDGNAAANRTMVSFVITGLSIVNNATFWFRWNDFNGTDADDGLSVDDYALVACETPTLCDILPVRLLYFNAEKNGQEVKLDWRTAFEINSDYFEIQRASGDGVFTTIGKINSAGENHDINSYRFIDHTPAKGINYYRLVQYDRDGRFEYSPIRPLLFSEKNLDITFSPNPAREFISIEYHSALSQCEISLTDLTGKIVWHEISKTNSGITEIKVDRLNPGTYILFATSDTGYFVDRIVVTNQ